MNLRKTIFLRILLILGIGIFFYPNISDYVNSITESRGIVSYNHSVDRFESLEKEKIRERAIAYNREIFHEKDALYDSSLVSGYEDSLNPLSDGMMGFLIIDKIGVNLPIYHGVKESVIQKGIGHFPGSSLPVGGESTHAVLSSHSGLPEAKLFTNLYKLEEGDEFIISVLGENIYYKVNQIKTVLPNELEDLAIEEGEDYVTLATCTPYGINTHRLLVRGKRFYPSAELKQDELLKKTTKNIGVSILKIFAIFSLLFLIFISIIKDILFTFFRNKRK